MKKEKILISGCLMGLKVRYHGGDAYCNSQIFDAWKEEGRIVLICPEVSAGLPIPRPPSEIINGTAKQVFSREARVLTNNNIDRSDAFIQGALTALSLVKKHNIKLAVLKRNSPSCGNKTIHDGSFTGNIIPGAGVTAQLLIDNNVKVFNELEISDANEFLLSLSKK